MILIDADILIDIFRGYGHAVDWLDSVSQPVSIVGFAAMELIQGCHDSSALRRTHELLDQCDIVWLTQSDCARAIVRYGERRLRFGLDVLDALIAETAIGVGVPLHTFNTRHFAAYPELVTVQPYTKV